MQQNKYNYLNDYNDKIKEFINPLTGTGYIALRDINKIIRENINNPKRILDFGCGAGRSTRFLRELGFITDGVDISKTMIDAASKQEENFDKGNYYLINNHEDLSFLKKYDVIFNSFVLFEFIDENSLINYITALSNLISENGILISILNSEFLYTNNWLSCDNKFDQNMDLKSGDIAKVVLPEMNNIELFDTYWTEDDYVNFFRLSGFSKIKLYKPLGLDSDPYTWKDETLYPPYTIYVCGK